MRSQNFGPPPGQTSKPPPTIFNKPCPSDQRSHPQSWTFTFFCSFRKPFFYHAGIFISEHIVWYCVFPELIKLSSRDEDKWLQEVWVSDSVYPLPRLSSDSCPCDILPRVLNSKFDSMRLCLLGKYTVIRSYMFKCGSFLKQGLASELIWILHANSIPSTSNTEAAIPHRGDPVCYSCGCDNTTQFYIKLILTLIWLMHPCWTTSKFPKFNFQTKPFRSAQKKRTRQNAKLDGFVKRQKKYADTNHFGFIWIKGRCIFFFWNWRYILYIQT